MMLPKVVKKLIYIRYKKKYRKWIERLGISVSEEEMKRELKRMELAGTKLKNSKKTATRLSN